MRDATALLGLSLGLSLALSGCSKQEAQPPAPSVPADAAAPTPAEKKKEIVYPEPIDKSKPKPPPPKKVLALALSRFSGATPLPARVDLLVPQSEGAWQVLGFEDADSNVFHKAFALPGDKARLITLGGMKAAVKSWHTKDGWQSTTLWTEAFGGKFDRMRDAELGDVDGDGKLDIVVGTHDQGVVAYLKGSADKWKVMKLDKEPNTFIHEIELGDLNKDGVLEVYATPSEPNRLEAGAQSGSVVRYVPKKGEKRKVVADLGNRHAKEILVHDLDGDGKEELYVAVEALTKGERDQVEIVEDVEIRRYDADTKPTEGKVVARIHDRFCRFLTAGDVDGDGKRELIAAAYRSGVWLIKPAAKGAAWAIENIDAESSGFEHAALLTDLDDDGKDELYVAADDQGELHRYVWKDGKPERTTIVKRDNPRETWTWNIMAVPGSVAYPQ